MEGFRHVRCQNLKGGSTHESIYVPFLTLSLSSGGAQLILPYSRRNFCLCWASSSTLPESPVGSSFLDCPLVDFDLSYSTNFDLPPLIMIRYLNCDCRGASALALAQNVVFGSVVLVSANLLATQGVSGFVKQTIGFIRLLPGVNPLIRLGRPYYAHSICAL